MWPYLPETNDAIDNNILATLYIKSNAVAVFVIATSESMT